MSSKIYVGSLSYSVTDDDLFNFFEDQGEVVSSRVICDRDTGRSKGFGFVEMKTEEEANRAVESSNGASLQGRSIIVNIARERESLPRARSGTW